MKKIYLSVLAFAFATAGAMAQKIQAGPKIGLNLATISTSQPLPEGMSQSHTAGINLGAAFNVQLNEQVSIASEILFSQKGSLSEGVWAERAMGISVSYEQTDKMRLNYLEMPVLARFEFGDKTRVYGNAGPVLSYWMGGSHKGETVFGLGNTKTTEPHDAKIVFLNNNGRGGDDEIAYPRDNVNRLELGGAIGGGLLFDTSAGDLLLDLRYTAGFTKFLNLEERNNPEDSMQYRNRVLSLSVVFLLGSW